MTIHSINIINLKRRTDLEIAQRAVWDAMGADPGSLVFHEAVDGTAFQARDDIIELAKSEGFDFFQPVPEDHWSGIGEMATLLSISRLLRYIGDSEQEDAIFLYVLADRCSKKRLPYLEALFERLPDFMFFQFKGHVPYWDHLDRETIKASYPREYVPGDDLVPENTIEIGNTKIGEGTLAMTPAGAAWEFAAIREFDWPLHGEYVLYYYGLETHRCPKGVYSMTFKELNPQAIIEGEFRPPLSGTEYSDLTDVNLRTQTGAVQQPNLAYQ